VAGGAGPDGKSSCSSSFFAGGPAIQHRAWREYSEVRSDHHATFSVPSRRRHENAAEICSPFYPRSFPQLASR
jgi:hypothetical protein